MTTCCDDSFRLCEAVQVGQLRWDMSDHLAVFPLPPNPIKPCKVVVVWCKLAAFA